MKSHQWSRMDIHRAREMGFALCQESDYVDAYHIVALQDTPIKQKFANDKQAAEFCINVSYGDNDKSTSRTKTCRKAVLICCLGSSY
jgi:hypothetical protein